MNDQTIPATVPENTLPAEIGGYVRAIVTGAGGILVYAGYSTTEHVQMAVGGALFVAGLVWTRYQKRRAARLAAANQGGANAS